MFPFKQLEEKFLSIPEDVQEAISSTETNKKLLDLANKYKLQFDEAEELTKEIGYVMLGLKPKKDFIKNVQKATELNFEESKVIAEDINNTIFAEIRESLRKIHTIPIEVEDEDLDEDLVREELLNELSNSTEKTTDLIKIPKKSLEHENIKTLKQKEPLDRVAIAREDGSEQTLVSTSRNEVVQETKENLSIDQNTNPPKAGEPSSQSPTPKEQKESKSYTIDPYREPIE